MIVGSVVLLVDFVYRSRCYNFFPSPTVVFQHYFVFKKLETYFMCQNLFG